MTILTPARVLRKYNTDGVPESGAHEVDKGEFTQLLENMQDNDGAAVSRTTLADLQLVTPTAGTFPRGEVKDDPDPANNGFYSWDADTSEWVFDRPFPDTLAVVTLSGTGAAQTGTVNSGVNPSSTVEFRAEVTTENTGPLTLSIGGEEPRPVVNLAGNALSAGEWTGVVKFFIDTLGNYKLANNPGSEAAAAQSATDAAATLAEFLTHFLGNFADDASAATAAGTPTEGQFYWNTTSKVFRYYDGSAWNAFPYATVADNSLTEPKYATGSVSTRALADGAATTDKIGAEAVTDEKVADTFKAKVMGVAADRTALAGMSGTDYLAVDLMEEGRKGLFYYSADASAEMMGPDITTTAVDAATDTMTRAGHDLWTGQPVVATATVNSVAAQTIYYVIRVDEDNFQLATSFTNALAETAMDLTGATNVTLKRYYDPTQGVYVPLTGDITGASGAWVRHVEGTVHAKWFGLGPSSGANLLAVNSAIEVAYANFGNSVRVPPEEIPIYVGLNGGIVVKHNTHLFGYGMRRSILNLIGGGSLAQLRNYEAGAGIRRNFSWPAGTNQRQEQILVERLAVVMNHPFDSITTTAVQIGIDMRNWTRSIVRECWVGNYHPTQVPNTKGGTAAYLVQGYCIITGNESSHETYAGGEVNTIEKNFVVGGYRMVCVDENLLSPVSAAYSTRVIGNDIQIGMVLIYQASQYGAGNVFRGNILQSTKKPAGNVNSTFCIYVAGYGNEIDEPYVEAGADCQAILNFSSTANNNRAKFSGTVSATGGLTGDAFVDLGGSSSNNVVEFFANTAGAGAHHSGGAPQRMISGTTTTQT